MAARILSMVMDGAAMVQRMDSLTICELLQMDKKVIGV